MKTQPQNKSTVRLIMLLVGAMVFGALLETSRRTIYSRHQRAAAALPHALFVEQTGTRGSWLVLLHGLFASHRYWAQLSADLSPYHNIVLPDLLGFGQSAWPDLAYTTEDHEVPLAQTLTAVIPRGAKFPIVGHSLGSLMALHHAALNPDRVSRLVLLSLPLFRSEAEARKLLAKSSSLVSLMSMNRILAPAFCYLHEALGSAAAPLFRPFMQTFPEAVIEDATQHTWRSFHGTLEHVIIHADVIGDLERFGPAKVLVVLGKQDTDQSAEELARITALGVEVRYVSGDHNFPLSYPEETTALIRNYLSRGEPSSP